MMKLSSSYDWQTTLSDVSINGKKIKLKETKNAIFDTGISFTYIEYNDFNETLTEIIKGKSCK